MRKIWETRWRKTNPISNRISVNIENACSMRREEYFTNWQRNREVHKRDKTPSACICTTEFFTGSEKFYESRRWDDGRLWRSDVISQQ